MSSNSSSGTSLAQPLRGGAPMSSSIDWFPISHRRQIGGMNSFFETGEDHFFGQGVLGQESERLMHRDRHRLVERIAIDAAADGGAGDPADAVRRRQAAGTAVASR